MSTGARRVVKGVLRHFGAGKVENGGGKKTTVCMLEEDNNNRNSSNNDNDSGKETNCKNKPGFEEEKNKEEKDEDFRKVTSTELTPSFTVTP